MTIAGLGIYQKYKKFKISKNLNEKLTILFLNLGRHYNKFYCLFNPVFFKLINFILLFPFKSKSIISILYPSFYIIFSFIPQ